MYFNKQTHNIMSVIKYYELTCRQYLRDVICEHEKREMTKFPCDCSSLSLYCSLFKIGIEKLICNYSY